MRLGFYVPVSIDFDHILIESKQMRFKTIVLAISKIKMIEGSFSDKMATEVMLRRRVETVTQVLF